MKTKYTLLPALAFVTLSASAQKLAVIDMQGAILSTKDGQKAAAELKTKYDPIQQAIAKRTQDLSAKQKAYQDKAAAMSDDARAAAEKTISDLTKDLQRDSDDARADSQQDQNRLVQPILQKLEAVMSRYAADKRITMIVDLSTKPNNLLYANAESNITNDVIALYNAEAAAPATAAPASAKPAPPAASAPAPVKKTAPPAAAKP